MKDFTRQGTLWLCLHCPIKPMNMAKAKLHAKTKIHHKHSQAAQLVTATEEEEAEEEVVSSFGRQIRRCKALDGYSTPDLVRGRGRPPKKDNLFKQATHESSHTRKLVKNPFKKKQEVLPVNKAFI